MSDRRFSYPPTPAVDVVDDYHGTPVADPYRWLEDDSAPETIEWIAEQNRLTRAFLDALPPREEIRARLTALWDYPRYSVPYKRGGRYFFEKNDGLQNQAVLYRQETLGGEAAVVLDPNTLSEDGTVALTNQAVSRDGRLLAYGTSVGGSDWQEIRVRSVDGGEDYPDLIRWCKFAGIAWHPDGAGFFYNRYPEPGSVPAADHGNYSRVYWHRLGADQHADELIYERPDDKELGFTPFVTRDGRYLLLRVWHGTDPQNRIYYRELGGDGPFIRLLDQADARYDFIDNIGPLLYFSTDLGAPRGRVIAIDLERPARANWREVVPERADPLAFAITTNGRLLLAYLRDVHHVLELRALDGALERVLELPTLGAVTGLWGRRDDADLLIGFESYLYPPTTLRYDWDAGELTTIRAAALDFDAGAYETRQVFYSSKDGTRVPMFLTHRKGLALDGRNPTLLYGYGGFNISMTPAFAPGLLCWIERGGVYAIANLRGGDEYGEEWHQAGMLDRKQNVFDDFIAAAEWLVASGYAATRRLGIMGGSNGGLLVAACMLQRPDLFGAVVCRVPVIDMLRYHRFTIGRYWVGEYGNAEEEPEHFRFMYAYSPLHNVADGAAYPPTLITTADTDDRVVPAHARKFAAALQAADAGANPILLRVEFKAGHGLGKPTARVIEELSDIYAFLLRAFGAI
ncbi:MAG: S9 family peptidase [Kouleothrix sp.]|nr:S9 family peptidase [Kouleothrix sp.]